MPRTDTSNQSPILSIQAADLVDRLTDPTVRILDARPLAAYNGWRLRDETRGGHIPGAGALPSEWLARLNDVDLRALADSTAWTAARSTVIYGYDADEAATLASRLAALGVTGISLLEPGWAAWAADDRRPIEHLPGFHQLVHPAWLRDVLDGGRPEAPPAGRVLLFHVNFGVPRSTPRRTCRVPRTSTRTGSRTRATGTAGRRPSWNARSPRSASATTPRSCSMDVTPRAVRTRSGRAVEQARSRPLAQRSSCATRA